MQLIDVADSCVTPPQELDAGAGEIALAGLIGAIGEPAFGERGLAQLNRWMPLCWWSIYRLFDAAPPTQHAMASFGVPDGTSHSWRVYRDSLYRFDQTFHAAREFLRERLPAREGRDDGGAAAAADGTPAARPCGLMHWHASEIPLRHRSEIYSRNGLRERLSIVVHDAGSLLAINFYRHDTQRGFSDTDIHRMRRFSRPLLACVDRHIAWRRSEPAPDVFAGLTQREREVCERLLKGWTHAGIAADLQVSPATVKTYRDRAFERLGIHHRNELFALALRANAA